MGYTKYRMSEKLHHGRVNYLNAAKETRFCAYCLSPMSTQVHRSIDTLEYVPESLNSLLTLPWVVEADLCPELGVSVLWTSDLPFPVLMCHLIPKIHPNTAYVHKFVQYLCEALLWRPAYTLWKIWVGR